MFIASAPCVGVRCCQDWQIVIESPAYVERDVTPYIDILKAFLTDRKATHTEYDFQS